MNIVSVAIKEIKQIIKKFLKTYDGDLRGIDTYIDGEIINGVLSPINWKTPVVEKTHMSQSEVNCIGLSLTNQIMQILYKYDLDRIIIITTPSQKSKFYTNEIQVVFHIGETITDDDNE